MFCPVSLISGVEDFPMNIEYIPDPPLIGNSLLEPAVDTTTLREAHYNATVLNVTFVQNSLIKIRIVADNGKLDYQPGQYTILALGGWEPRCDGANGQLADDLREKLIKRAYSIACPLFDDNRQFVCCRDYDFLEFYITLVPRPDDELPRRPPLTPRLFALQPGARLHMSTHIVGHYTLEAIRPEHNVVFAATGTGEAPHNAMAAELLKRGHQGRIASMTCTRFRKDAAYLTEQHLLNESFPNYRYRLYTTREPQNLDPTRDDYVGKQYLQEIMQPGKFEEEFGWSLDPANTHVFLCGNPDMIGIPRKNSAGTLEFPEPPGLLELLHQQGFLINSHDEGTNVHYEKYW